MCRSGLPLHVPGPQRRDGSVIRVGEWRAAFLCHNRKLQGILLGYALIGGKQPSGALPRVHDCVCRFVEPGKLLGCTYQGVGSLQRSQDLLSVNLIERIVNISPDVHRCRRGISARQRCSATR